MMTAATPMPWLCVHVDPSGPDEPAAIDFSFPAPLDRLTSPRKHEVLRHLAGGKPADLDRALIVTMQALAKAVATSTDYAGFWRGCAAMVEHWMARSARPETVLGSGARFALQRARALDALEASREAEERRRRDAEKARMDAAVADALSRMPVLEGDVEAVAEAEDIRRAFLRQALSLHGDWRTKEALDTLARIRNARTWVAVQGDSLMHLVHRYLPRLSPAALSSGLYYFGNATWQRTMATMKERAMFLWQEMATSWREEPLGKTNLEALMIRWKRATCAAGGFPYPFDRLFEADVSEIGRHLDGMAPGNLEAAVDATLEAIKTHTKAARLDADELHTFVVVMSDVIALWRRRSGVETPSLGPRARLVLERAAVIDAAERNEAALREERNDAEEARITAAVDAAMERMPDLRGTEKQVAWAESLRAGFLHAAVSSLLPEAAEKAVAALARIREARVWIDARDEPLDCLVKGDHLARG